MRRAVALVSISARIAGSADIYQGKSRGPMNSVNFVTAHDGFTLNDLVSYNGKHNDANGEDNRDGMDDNISWNCGVEGETDDEGVRAFRKQQIKNFAAILFLSQALNAVLLLAKAAQGVGSALAFVSATRYLAALYGTRRNHFALGLYGAGFPLGSALALVLMPTLALTFGGWRAAFGGEAALIALVTLAWTRTPEVAHAAAQGDMRDALRCGNCWWTSVQHAAGFGLALASGTWITVYLLREFALPLALSGALGSTLLALAVLGRAAGGWLVAREHVPTRLIMRGAEVAIIAGVGLLALPARPLPAALAGALLVGIGVGLPYAAVFNTAAASLPAAPAAAQGLAAIGGTAGVMVGAPAMGLAVQTYGFSAAWLFVGAVAAIAFAGTFLMRGEEDL